MTRVAGVGEIHLVVIAYENRYVSNIKRAIMQNEVTLRVTNSKILKEILLSSY